MGGWRWILIIEGLVTIFFSVFVFIFTPHFPGRDKGLGEHDTARLLGRLEADKGKEKTSLDRIPWTKVLLDYKIWVATLLFFCADMSAGSLSSFNPTILSQLGWTAKRAQVMTIPVWVAGIIGALSVTLISGRINKRWPFIIPAILVSIVGWSIHVAYLEPGVRYFAQFLISLGTFVQM
jgi:cyanate permease